MHCVPVLTSFDGFQLNEYELAVASNLVDPNSITVSWKDVAGLDVLLQELHDTLILPVKNRKQFESSRLLQPPKGIFCKWYHSPRFYLLITLLGILLHGPPGCGKTMVSS